MSQQTEALWASVQATGKNKPCRQSSDQKSVYLDCININFPALRKAENVRVGENAFDFVLPDGTYISVGKVRYVRKSGGISSFWGFVMNSLPGGGSGGTSGSTLRGTSGGGSGDVAGSVSLTIRENKLYGHLTLKSGYFQIEPDASGHHVLRRVLIKEPREGTDAVRLNTDAVKTKTANADRYSASSGPGYTIDVLVLYNREAAADIASANGNPELKFESWIDWTNQAIANGENNQVRFRLVRTHEVDYVQAEDLGSDLKNLQEPSDGLLDEAQLLRETSGADLVVLVPARSVGTACGVAYVGEPFRNRDIGFSVIANSCSARTFAHELGHNIGMLHDPYVATYKAMMPYRYGYVDLDAGFRTIMAYSDLCMDNGVGCSIIQYYSNPDIYFSGRPIGTPIELGTATSDNDRVLREMGPQVEAYTRSAEPGTFGIIGHIGTETGFPVSNVGLSIVGISQMASTDKDGAFIFTGIKDGVYSVRPSKVGFEFNPSQVSIEISDGDILGVDFRAVLAESRMTISLVEQSETPGKGNNDGQANPGEFKMYSVQLSNTGQESIIWPRLIINTTNIGIYAESLLPAQTIIQVEFASGDMHEIEKYPLQIDGDTPDGTRLELPWVIYDGHDRMVATDIIEISVSGTDQTPPFFEALFTSVSPSIVDVGASTTLRAYVYDGSDISTVTAILYDAVLGVEVDRLALTPTAEDRIFQATYIPNAARALKVELRARDDKGNVAAFEIETQLQVRSYVASESVLVVANGSYPQVDYSELYVESLLEIGTQADVWAIQERGWPSSELLLLYEYIVWTNGHPSITFEQTSGYNLIREYLERGGNLLLTGDRIAWGADIIEPGWLESVAQSSHTVVVPWLGNVDGVLGQESQFLSVQLTGSHGGNLMHTTGEAESLFAWGGGPAGAPEGSAAIEYHSDVYDLVLASFGLEHVIDPVDREAILTAFVDALNPTGSNRPPQNIAPVDSVVIELNRPPMTINLAPLFMDLDRDVLSYQAVSTNSDLVHLWVGTSTMMITPESVGSGIVIIYADDGNGATANVEMFVTVVNGVNVDDDEQAVTFELQQNYPNPFSDGTTIRFSIPDYTVVTLKVFDVMGREVRTLVDQTLNPGNHSINLDSQELPSGMYIYHLTTRDAAATRSMLVVN